MAWKYIMFSVNDLWQLPVIFPDKLVHADVAAALFPLVQQLTKKPETVRISSAGMIEHIDPMGVHGKSETLNIDSHSADEDIITTLPYAHGIGFK